MFAGPTLWLFGATEVEGWLISGEMVESKGKVETLLGRVMEGYWNMRIFKGFGDKFRSLACKTELSELKWHET